MLLKKTKIHYSIRVQFKKKLSFALCFIHIYVMYVVPS
jgi:hypothetical protein